MKIIVFFFTFFLSTCFSATVPVTCSTQAGLAVINEVNTHANFIEIYLLQSSDIHNWELFVDALSVKQLGNGDCFINGTTTKDNQSNGSNSTTFPAGTFITCNTNMNPSSNEILLTNQIISHEGSPGAVIIDYLGYGNLANPAPDWSAPEQCGNLFPDHQPSASDIVLSPDGTFTDNGDNSTPGVWNAVCTNFTYDIYHSVSPYRLQTRIAQRAFDVNVTVACVGTDEIPARKITNIYAINNGDPCVIASSQLELWSSSPSLGTDINNTIRTVPLSNLSSSKAFSNIKLMLKTNNNEYNCSTDSFSIRPSSYNISPSSAVIKATHFPLQVSAINSGGGYNGTANIATALQIPNPNCPVTSGFITSALGSSLTFLNDSNTSEMNASDVGAVYLNIKDSTWTNSDQIHSDCIPDSNSTVAVSGKFGCNIENNLSIRIIPDHFDLNATLSNFGGGGFTYLSTDLNMSATLDLNVTAKNSDGNVTKNYTSGCFAKTTSITLPHSSVPSPLSKILYHDSINAIDANISSNSPITLSFTENKFSQGTVLPKITFNFDRNISKPLNGFDFNVTSADVNDTDNVVGNTTSTGKSTFVYGRARAYDLKTDQNTSVPNPIELEVYSTTSNGYVTSMPQNILHWYRNLNHNTLNAGRVIGGGFTVGVSDNTQVNALASPINGIHPVTMTSTANQTVHLDISPWLWYSPSVPYNYTTNCTAHPCFNYQYFGTAASTNSGVNSGTFQGSDFNLAPAKTIIKKGVKVFR